MSTTNRTIAAIEADMRWVVEPIPKSLGHSYARAVREIDEIEAGVTDIPAAQIYRLSCGPDRQDSP